METAIIQFIENSCSLKQQKFPHPPLIMGFCEAGIFREDTKGFTSMVGFSPASLLGLSLVQNYLGQPARESSGLVRVQVEAKTHVSVERPMLVSL